jgi:hypothetical protein
MSNPSASTCGGRKLIPRCVERRGSIGTSRHRSVSGREARLTWTSEMVGTVQMIVEEI